MCARPILLLGRHAETESERSGAASPGTRFLFTSLEAALRSHFDILPIPVAYYRGDRREALRIAFSVLRQADACLLGLPPEPTDLEQLFLVRERLGAAIPFVYMPLGELPRGAWCYRHLHRLFRASDLILFSSDADRAIFDRLVAAMPAERTVMPFGIYTDRFKPMLGERCERRRELRIRDDETVLVYHGRTSAEKNVHELLSLTAELLPRFPGVRLWIVGAVADGNEMSTLYCDLLENRMLAARTTFWGHLDRGEVPSVLAAADIAVTLTLNLDENFGFGVVEAMASGLPVVGTDWGGLKDTIAHEVTGFKIRTCVSPAGAAFDRTTARERIESLVSNRELRLRMGEAGRRLASERFEIARVAQSLADRIVGLIARRDEGSIRHCWTRMGRQLDQSFMMTDRSNAARVVAAPVPQTPTMLRDNRIMHRLIEGYASAKRPACRDDRLMPATPFFSIEGNRVRSRDPRYAFEGRELTALETRVLAKLKSDAVADLPGLERFFATSETEESIRAAVSSLRRAGIIVSFSR